MNEKFNNYLQSINITKILLERIETFYDFFKKICPDEIVNIFVTDYINKDGSRHFEDLWFFSQMYAMEAKLFTEKDDFDITPLTNRIVYLRIKKQDYDFQTTTEKSRLYIFFALDTGITGELKASKGNCSYLKNIMFEHILPNLKK